jgi:hypothetical protein
VHIGSPRDGGRRSTKLHDVTFHKTVVLEIKSSPMLKQHVMKTSRIGGVVPRMLNLRGVEFLV